MAENTDDPKRIYGLKNTLTAEDKWNLQDLFTRYAWSYDCADEDGFLANFLPDAVVLGHDDEHVGIEAIKGWFRYLIDIRKNAGEAWQHDVYHMRFDGNSQACRVYAYATHFHCDITDRHHTLKEYGVRSAGYYVDDCVNVDGVWYFKRHSIHYWESKGVPWQDPELLKKL